MAISGNTITVSSAAELRSALGNASAGDTILLKSGSYGHFDVSGYNFSDFVTITSEDGAGGAVFEEFNIKGSSGVRASNLTFENLSNDVQQIVKVSDSDRVEILDSEFSGTVDGNYGNDPNGAWIDNSSNVVFQGNLMHDLGNGAKFRETTNLIASENRLVDIGSDGFDFVGVQHVRIENNFMSTFHPGDGAHGDFVQFWHLNTDMAPFDVAIRGNLFLEDSASGDSNKNSVHGIFIGDPPSSGYKNFDISENIIYTSSLHGITVSNMHDSSITNNTVLTNPFVRWTAKIDFNGSNLDISNNVTTGFQEGVNTAFLSNNLVAQYDDPGGANYYDDLYVDAFAGNNVTLEDLVPLEGSKVDFGSGLGAEQRTLELLNSENNTAPEAVNDSASTQEETPVTVDVLANDSDPDGEALSVSRVGAPNNGIASVNADGTVTYTPDVDFNGEDSFSYTLSDASGGRDIGTVTVSVTGTPDAPKPVDDSISVQPDTTATFDVLANDADPDGDPITLDDYTLPSNGSLVQNADGTFSYTPDAGYLGSDSFTYTVSDDTGRSSTATATLNVRDLPPALLSESDMTFDGTTSSAVVLQHDTSYEVAQGTVAVEFTADTVAGRQGVLSKDSGGNDDGGHLTLLIENGDLVARLQSASQTHALTAADAIGVGQAHQVAVTFGDAGFKLYIDGAATAQSGYTGGISANAEPIVVGANQWASGDQVANNLEDPLDGKVASVTLFDEALSASDLATLREQGGGSGDGGGNTDPVNTAPVAGDDSASTTEDTAVKISPLANDSDADGDVLGIGNLGQPANGTATLNADGTVTYRPDANFNGQDSFGYTVADGNGGTDTATVTIDVAAAPDRPIARADSAAVWAGDSVAIDVLANDSDADGDTLSVLSFDQPSKGSVTQNADGTLAYTANADASGTDSFTYTVGDGTGRSDSATVSIDVNTASSATPLFEQGPGTYDGTTSSAVVLAHDASYEIAQGTLLIDFTPDTVSGRQGLMSKDSSGFDDGGHLSVLIENGDLVARLQSDSNTFAAAAPGALAAGQSYQAALTFGPDGMKLYLDGALAGQDAYTGGITANIEPIVIGANQWASGDGIADTIEDAFDGEIAGVSLYADAMTAEEIQALASGSSDPAPSNTAPTAVDDTVGTDEDTPVTLDVLANDEDADGDTLTVSQLGSATNGTAALNADGSVTYTPDAGFAGADSFTYTVVDGNGGSDTATVDVSVNAVDLPPATIGEFGRIANLTHELRTVQLDHSYENPVVFALPASFDGFDPATVRLSDVRSDSFSVQMQEPNYLDGWHGQEDVSFLVLEAGSWQLDDGTRLEVGAQTWGSLTGGAWEQVDFASSLSATPSVLTQVQTLNGPDFVQTRQKDASASGFSFALEEEEADSSPGHVDETVGWLAIEQGSGIWDGHAFEAGTTGNKVDDGGHALSFTSDFGGAPQFLASIATFNGSDATMLRYENLDAGGVNVRLQEEQSGDSETVHIDETVDYLAIDGSGALTADSFDLFS